MNNNNQLSEEALVEAGISPTQQQANTGDQAARSAEQGIAQSQANSDLVNAMYESSNPTQNNQQAAGTQGQNQQQPQPSEAERLEAVRKKLHQQRHDEVYVQPTFAYEHRKQETVQERLQREDQEKEQKKMEELKKKEEKGQVPLAVSRGQTSTERQRGAAG